MRDEFNTAAYIVGAVFLIGVGAYGSLLVYYFLKFVGVN